MLDIKFIRENAELVKDAARKKHVEVDIDELLALDDRRRELLSTVEEGRAKQHEANTSIQNAAPDRREEVIAEMRELKEGLQKKEEELKEVMKAWQSLMVAVPNIPDMSVPEGKSDADNQEIEAWGEKRKFSFHPKNHVELMTHNDMADFERGAKVGGFRGYFLKNDGVRLSFAIWNFVRAEFESQGNFIPLMAPSLVRREPFIGTGYLPQGEDDLYKTQDDLYLTGTSEVSVMGSFMDEVIEEKDLPLRYLAFSPCFRREAGSYGKDAKGIFRVHEFFKLEQIILCEADHEESVRQHEFLTKNAEQIMQKLTLPYRKVVNCAGDLGLGQVKKYDIEAWVPSENTYRETHSASYFHDFQTRRLNIRYRDGEGKLRYAHSLNNTAAATPRILISIIENNQREDGSIAIPEALQPYMGKDVIVPAR
jgi:seryl-tRNA synthetase